jgi:hypothetical protein
MSFVRILSWGWVGFLRPAGPAKPPQMHSPSRVGLVPTVGEGRAATVVHRRLVAAFREREKRLSRDVTFSSSFDDVPHEGGVTGDAGMQLARVGGGVGAGHPFAQPR